MPKDHYAKARNREIGNKVRAEYARELESHLPIRSTSNSPAVDPVNRPAKSSVSSSYIPPQLPAPVPMRQENLEYHGTDVARAKQKGQKRGQSKVPFDPYIRCDICECRLKPESYQKHLRRVHPTPIAVPPSEPVEPVEIVATQVDMSNPADEPDRKSEIAALTARVIEMLDELSSIKKRLSYLQNQ